MDSGQFNKKIQEIIKKAKVVTNRLTQIKSFVFLNILEKIYLSQTEESNKFTQMSILLEGFYQSLSIDSELKPVLLNIRIWRWRNHYGTPTVLYLLTHDSSILKVKESFLKDELDHEKIILSLLSIAEWNSFDPINQVYIASDSACKIEEPPNEEAGKFLKTYNPSGGFTTTPSDPISLMFLEYTSEIAKAGGNILEIGAAFGATSLKVLDKGATVYCNDIDAKNLAVVRNRYLKGVEESSLTGDDSRLKLLPGEFPDELSGLSQNFFDAILVCRVMHFFTGAQIEKSLKALTSLLKPGGKAFIVCETPFLKNWQKFIPEYKRRLQAEMQWPGEINNPAEFESSGRAASLPKFVHWITSEVMEKALKSASFDIEHLEYIDRNGQFPEDLLFDGRESIGAIAIKPL